MAKKFMCVKHAEDCYALQEAVRFVAFFGMYCTGIGLCLLQVSEVECQSITLTNTLDRPSISASVDNWATCRSSQPVARRLIFVQCTWVSGHSADYLPTVECLSTVY